MLIEILFLMSGFILIFLLISTFTDDNNVHSFFNILAGVLSIIAGLDVIVNGIVKISASSPITTTTVSNLFTNGFGLFLITLSIYLIWDGTLEFFN